MEGEVNLISTNPIPSERKGGEDNLGQAAKYVAEIGKILAELQANNRN